MVRKVSEKEKQAFNRLAAHPLQAWEWGEFREKTGVKVVRLGRYEEGKLAETAQVTIHKIPKLPWSIGYWPKGVIPSREMAEAVKEEAVRHGAIMVKMEPNVLKDKSSVGEMEKLGVEFLLKPGREMFTRWSFWLNLDKSEEELLAGMKSKTRYNTRLAEKKGVEVVTDETAEGFEEYWKLTEETTRRQGFYAHTKKYHRLMFETLVPAGMAKLFKAVYKGEVLATWIVFVLNGVLYYPYGGSTSRHREVMASNAMMWEAIKWGKKQGCRLFDLWGSPGPNPAPSDSWYGFHHFKEGFGARLVEFVGTYDLVVDGRLYPWYRFGNDWLRWKLLRIKAALGR